MLQLLHVFVINFSTFLKEHHEHSNVSKFFELPRKGNIILFLNM